MQQKLDLYDKICNKLVELHDAIQNKNPKLKSLCERIKWFEHTLRHKFWVLSFLYNFSKHLMHRKKEEDY